MVTSLSCEWVTVPIKPAEMVKASVGHGNTPTADIFRTLLTLPEIQRRARCLAGHSADRRPISDKFGATGKSAS